MKFVESLILIPVPEAEAAVGKWRQKYDSSARRGVPAHITLIYPFQNPDKVDEVTHELKLFFENTRPFGFELTKINTFPPKVIFLEPSPREAFIKLIQKLVELYPDTPPYAGQYPEINPHLTLAVLPQEADFQKILEKISQDLGPKLPLAAEARQAQLMVKDEDRLWHFKELFPFGLAG